nr:uncharacterized protein LOC116153893 [Camelus dromedarius]
MRKEAKPASPVPRQRAADSSRTSSRRLGWAQLVTDDSPDQSPRGARAASRSARLVPPRLPALLSLGQFPGLCPELLRARRPAISRRGERGAGARRKRLRPPWGGPTWGRREGRQSDPYFHQSGVAPGEGGGAMHLKEADGFHDAVCRVENPSAPQVRKIEGDERCTWSGGPQDHGHVGGLTGRMHRTQHTALLRAMIYFSKRVQSKTRKEKQHVG